jgi:putative endopeptidase
VGDLGSLWATEADSQEFQRRAQLLIDCYNAFDLMPFETGLKADGAYTVSENVADLGGFFLAYDSYIKYLDKQGFKGEQRRLQIQQFYEACGYLWGGKWTADYALMRAGDASRPEEQDVHSLFRERVNGIVSNTDDWYDLFDVKAGDKLYLAPEKRARIW